MSKTFFEVFPTLKMDDELRLQFEGVEVEKVATNSRRDYLNIHIFSRHLIQKRYIYAVENAVKEQLFAKNMISIAVMESYELSEQYTPENLMREYYDSLLLEVCRKSRVECNMLKTASYSFENGNILCLQFLDTVVVQGKKDSLVKTIQTVFEERFHVPIEMRVAYEKPKESRLKFNELQLQQEVEAILERGQALSKERQEKEQTEEQKKEPEKAKADAEAGTDREKKQKKPFAAQNQKEAGGKKYGYGRQAGKNPNTGGGFRKSNDPNVVFGRDFDDAPIPLHTVAGEMGEITIRGKVISFDAREIRNEKTILIYAVTDFTDTIMVKMFVRNEQLPDLLAEIKEGAFLKIKGVTTIDKFDGQLTIGSVAGVRKITDFTVSRKDTYPEKRVELHCHTKMSDMDGVSEVTDIVKRAHDWGHKAIAITDHGVVQAFTDANHYIERLEKDDPFKIIYGVEAYLVDDLKDVAVNEKGQTLEDTFVVFDLETTGFSPISDRIIEIGAVKVEQGRITERFSSFVCQSAGAHSL